ncbi:ribonuclease YeeF family protein [Bacillus sonorensis]|uniref:ribonuclease YeeF family protein n=1 Tax=Bacillus sonorensis TaxID=119858 RepID=UPI0018CCB4CB|nr:LXG domain-containing protein [Bacillus sonorensis]MBG9913424.1 transposase [Bacillus sonorensis]MCY8035446.1 LXG domain-containing protein [Bacillus sonorensis]MCY8087822.1 LXG domain-containing protein [Bacillus sonorensis]MCY8562788.1 LXG domain-containing protein [Bacillus sonorensis]MCZ0070169.1 LXG domain-containing protein [Bacillus sonorensis]
MKTLDVQTFQNGLDKTLSELKNQKDDISKVKQSVKGITSLDDALKGSGGEAIRSFYEECHTTFLLFYESFISDYKGILEKTKSALHSLEPNHNGFISQSFLENELHDGVSQAESLTAKLTAKANQTAATVSHIVDLPDLDDSAVNENAKKAKRQISETLEKLHTFDREQTNALKAARQDLDTMKQYVEQLEKMYTGPKIEIQDYQSGSILEPQDDSTINQASGGLQSGVQNTGKTPMEKMLGRLEEKAEASLKKTDKQDKDKTSTAHEILSYFETIGEPLDVGDKALLGYHAANATASIAWTRKLKIYYQGGKPTKWQRIKGEYKFQVMTHRSWTSQGDHSSKIANKIKSFSNSNPSNPLLKKAQNFVASYDSPSMLFKHAVGFPKNQHSFIDGKEFRKRTALRTKASTADIIESTAKVKGLSAVEKSIPFVSSAVTIGSNLTEYTDPANSDKTFFEKTGRAVTGIGVDVAAVSAGTEIGATIGSVGGPVGVIVGGAIGGVAGAFASSTYGDAIKDAGEKVAGSIEDGVKSGIESIKKWFN